VLTSTFRIHPDPNHTNDYFTLISCNHFQARSMDFPIQWVSRQSFMPPLVHTGLHPFFRAEILVCNLLTHRLTTTSLAALQTRIQRNVLSFRLIFDYRTIAGRQSRTDFNSLVEARYRAHHWTRPPSSYKPPSAPQASCPLQLL